MIFFHLTGSEIQRLKTELEKTKLEKDRFIDIIRNAGKLYFNF